MPALTKAERERVRYHLGYPQVALAGSMSLGIPRPIQTAFLVETAMSQLLDETVDRVRAMLVTLDGVEAKLIEAQDFLVAEKLGEMTLRDHHPERLEGEYVRWAMRLADVVGVPLYPYSARFKNWPGNVAGNIPVSH